MEMTGLNEKIEFFLENKVKVHIDLLDGTFLNGFIVKKIKKDVYWLEEDKLGQVFVFSKDIVKIQQNFKGVGK